MNRRQVLKNLGMGVGFLMVGPTTLNLLQSCKNKPSYNWEPLFLSATNGFALKQILEVILPKTDSPGSDDLNLAQFIDSYLDEVASEDYRENFKNNADAFAEAFKNEFNKVQGKGSNEEYSKIVTKYLKESLKEQEQFAKRITETEGKKDSVPEEEFGGDSGIYVYLRNIRDLGIWAWKTSEEIGEEVLWYDPVPGEFIGCIDINDYGNGKTMSL
jgi:hypothetical protein